MAKAKIVGDEEADIPTSDKIKLYVNDIHNERGVGVSNPGTSTVGEVKTIVWEAEYMQYYHHLVQGKQEGEVKTSEKVDIRLFYDDCTPVDGVESSIFGGDRCYEQSVLLTPEVCWPSAAVNRKASCRIATHFV